MSGLEALGGIAAATQIFSYLLQALFELRDQIKYAPARVQGYLERLDSLRRTVQYIQDHPILVTNVVEALLKTILEQVAGIRGILHKSFSREPRSLARRLTRLYVERMAEQQIRESLANLESYKSDLMICISSTMERSTTGMLLEDGGISLETVTRDSAAVIRKTVTAQGNDAPSQRRGERSAVGFCIDERAVTLVASGQRSGTLISTLSTDSEEMHSSTSSIGSDDTLHSTSSTEREETANSDRMHNSTCAENQGLSFVNNVVEDNGVGAMGNYGKVVPQLPYKFTKNSVRRNQVVLMGNMDCEALGMMLKAGGISEFPLRGFKMRADA